MDEGAGGEELGGIWPPAAALHVPEPGDSPWLWENAVLGPFCLFGGNQRSFPR